MLEAFCKEIGRLNGPIHDCQTLDDAPKFQHMWYYPNQRLKIDIDNDKLYPEIWDRRFANTEITTYKELYPNL